jgi:phosphomannomutase / phosphoglucomutase
MALALGGISMDNPGDAGCPAGRHRTVGSFVTNKQVLVLGRYKSVSGVVHAATANTLEYEQNPLVKPTGFREYDARWLFESELNLAGALAVGQGFATLLHRRKVKPRAVIGHDYRSYSASIKYAFATGAMAGGVEVQDVGLCTTSMAYFAQFALDLPAVAMITASHNENGWTGIKMGLDRPVTLGPEDMAELREIVLDGKAETRSGGGYIRTTNIFESYLADLAKEGEMKRKLKVAAVCGNGTAGAFAPQVLRAIGCDVVEIDCRLDHTFPNYNPNPEDLKMLAVMQRAIKEHHLDAAFGFDGDGDRCGVVDNEGKIIFADKMGLMMARDMAAIVHSARFVVDVKSTGLFATDPVLQALGASVDYYKTGHSYIKRRTRELDAVAGFEKSGHFFFRKPFGHGYDDGFATAIAICRMLDRAPEKSLADLYSDLPTSFSSPTMSPHCADEEKYAVVERLTSRIAEMHAQGATLAGQTITSINTINGVRFALSGGGWGLVRASSNKPELVVVCESMTSAIEMKAIFLGIRGLLSSEPAVKDFNQEI